MAMSKKPIRRISIGIDPGTYGGLAAIVEYPSSGDREPEVLYETMPDSEKGIFKWFSQFPMNSSDNQIQASLEFVHSMPKMGVKAMFTFGQNYGMLKMALTAFHITDFELVRPEAWQRSVGLKFVSGEEKKDRKERLRKMASRKFKELAIWKTPKTRGVQLKIADALLLALYCQKTRR